MAVIQSDNDLTLESNSTVTKGLVKVGTSAYDEANNRLGLLTQAPSADLSLGGEADFTIQQEREATAATPGRHTLIQAGGAKLGSTDKAGGTLKLAGGISTGSGTSKVELYAAPAAGSGTADNTPAVVVIVEASGAIVAGDLDVTGTSTLGDDVSITGDVTFAAAASIGVADAVADVGASLGVSAGAGDGTDKAGGDLVMSSGISTGTGTSKVTIKTSPAGSTSATANTPAVALEVRGDGTVIAGHQAALLAQNATAGFLMIPAVATGAPSGTPANIPTGQTAITFCAATGKLYVWDGTSAWKAYTPDGA